MKRVIVTLSSGDSFFVTQEEFDKIEAKDADLIEGKPRNGGEKVHQLVVAHIASFIEE